MELNKVSRDINEISSKVPILEVWLQIRKDFALAGVVGLSDKTPVDSNSLVRLICEFIVESKSKTTNWDNLNYRVDLPSSIDYSSLSALEYAQLIAYRGLQKVWFRKQFDEASKQDSFEKKPLP